MAILQSCCCWRTVRQGSFASGIYTASYFALTILMMANFLNEERLHLSSTPENPYSTTILEPETISHTTMTISIVILCSSSCGFLTSLLLLYGVYTDRKFLLVPWIFTIIIATIIELVHCVYIFINETLRFNPSTAILFTIDFFLLSLNVYSFLCVVSQYQEYQAGRGTAQYHLEHVPCVEYIGPSTATSYLTSTRRGTSFALGGGVTEAQITPPPSPTQNSLALPDVTTAMSRRPSSKRVQFPVNAPQTERRGKLIRFSTEPSGRDLDQ
ncbi:uncharacterized protein LOC123295778 isoform X2 [Chrysoperla carnea]|uniref:uncharacterized protein LOC123295778 isoform X2 n=1 Tax=Chrysoperla carnea TaxID=189513 RepID=UPI001D08F3A0|nr:uncharacterized protein LOC123295778 isoform X2 [Chrysoperla carnea]